MTEQQVIARLRSRIGGKTQREYAKDIGVSDSFLSDVLKRSRPPSGKILRALGLERVVTYARSKA